MYDNDGMSSKNVRVKVLTSGEDVGGSIVVEEPHNAPLIDLMY